MGYIYSIIFTNEPVTNPRVKFHSTPYKNEVERTHDRYYDDRRDASHIANDYGRVDRPAGDNAGFTTPRREYPGNRDFEFRGRNRSDYKQSRRENEEDCVFNLRADNTVQHNYSSSKSGSDLKPDTRGGVDKGSSNSNKSRRSSKLHKSRGKERSSVHRRRRSTSSESSSDNSRQLSESENSSTDDSANSGDDEKKHRRGREHGKRRSRSPPMPKMSSFSGDVKENWEAFILQFERIADEGSWSAKKMLRRLYQCLSGQASLYANRLRCKSYRSLKKELSLRFSKKEEAFTARRQLRSVRQRELETLEEFSQRVYELADDAYHGESKKSIERNAAEHFLSGARDKRAAEKAMEGKPNSLRKALKAMKQAQATTMAIYGTARPEFK